LAIISGDSDSAIIITVTVLESVYYCYSVEYILILAGSPRYKSMHIFNKFPLPSGFPCHHQPCCCQNEKIKNGRQGRPEKTKKPALAGLDRAGPAGPA
jgi:hypothetical protein